MFRSAFTLFFLIFIRCLTSQAATFTVISNADSGLGTLRQALLDAAANGSAEKDFIHFNIADQSEAGRTITVTSNLPNVSSNLEIDGTTQPGNKFGITDAKVKVQGLGNRDAQVITMFNLNNCNDVEIYGLFIDQLPNQVGNYSSISNAFWGTSVKNIVIGAPGKGNIIKNLGSGIHLRSPSNATEQELSENIRISSNILGLNEDGETTSSLGISNLWIHNARNVIIGGTTRAEGNVIMGQLEYSDFLVRFDTGNILLGNNILGLNYTGTRKLAGRTEPKMFITVTKGQQLNIIKNTFGTMSLLSLKSNCFFEVKGNCFGTDITGTETIDLPQQAIVLGYCTGGGRIGGSSPEDANFFSGAFQRVSYQNPSGVILNVGSPNVEVTGNHFKCNGSALPYEIQAMSVNQFASVSARNANEISGKATPNSRVDLYYSLSNCNSCEPEQLFSSVLADSNGDWKYTGALLNQSIIASSTLNGVTSIFTGVNFINNAPDIEITPACNGNNGSIKGLKTSGATRYTWLDNNNLIVGDDINLENASPGKYHLLITDGFCSKTSMEYEIKNMATSIDDTQKQTVSPSCNQNGQITGLQGVAGATYVWKAADGSIKGNALDVYNLPAGTYTLTVTIPNVTCTATYGPITLTNASGPQISSTPPAITNTPCGQSTGSVIGLGVSGGTGTLTYSWKNAAGQQVSPLPYLTGQRAGRYTLTVTDAAGCTAESAAFTILETNGITLNDNGQPTQPDCDGNLGKITGITATGATSYRWYNVITNQTVATTANASNLQPGTYRLEASNGNGCSQTSTTYTINTPGNNEFYGIVSSQKTPATCGLNNGSITVIFTDPTAVRPKSVRWAKQGGNQNLGSAYTIGNLDAGNYDLYVTAQNGCEKLLGGTFVVDRIPGLSVDVTAANVKPDECGLNNGSITGINVSQATSPVYTWTNASGQVVGNTLNLINKPVGTYTLKIQDGACQQTLPAMSIGSSNAIIQQPDVKDLQLCGGGDVLLAVLNPSSQYMYRLYDDAFSSTPIGAQASGQFKVKAESSRSYYISQYKGNCESARAELRVTVGSIGNQITNAFTPNNDGVNDTWRINNIENYPNALIQIFNRHGNKVFQSTGYTRPFDGSYQGRVLPAGVYYYIINLNTGCKVLTGSVTLLR